MSSPDGEKEGSRSFEESLAELEGRVRQLEGGELPLEEALKVFEEGITLTRTCHEMLDDAEQRITELTRGAAGEINEKEL